MLTKQLSIALAISICIVFRGDKAGPQDVCGRADICAARAAKKGASPWLTDLWQEIEDRVVCI
jgi:hypothetical protein